METSHQPQSINRYNLVTDDKSGGATYTPKILADFVAQQIVSAVGRLPMERPLRVLDPGVGHGELVASLLENLSNKTSLAIEVYGFETNPQALDTARKRIGQKFPGVSVYFEQANFLDFVLENFGRVGQGDLLGPSVPEAYDLIIANPPYVRTQIMGAAQAQVLAEQFGLEGRVDLYYAFILGISRVLKHDGIAGIIVSNRFMTTRSGAPVRQALFDRFDIRHVWDLGDTKLFDAAVLPAVLLVEGKNGHSLASPTFTSIYEAAPPAQERAADPLAALNCDGVVQIDDGRYFRVQHGTLNTSGTPDGIWRVATEAGDAWLATVDEHTWGTFRDIGKIRVGVKTCADKIFIRNDWKEMPEAERPELLKPLTTHHVARRFKALSPDQPSEILYPHEVVQGRRQAVELARYPRSEAYLERHRHALERRRYVLEAGRQWYEAWVPQDPNAWDKPKLVFRDIAEQPTFWLDLDGSVVNGDCYWLLSEDADQTDLLWLAAAVGNSSFIERFYDLRFQNKLYAGRRRFMAQYVEKFPLPDPESPQGKAIVTKAKQVYDCIPSSTAEDLEAELDTMVWEALTGGRPA